VNWKTTGTILDGARSDSSCSSTDKASGMTAKMQEITMELRENRKERERLLKRIDGHRHASEYVARTAHKSARPTQYSDQAAGWHSVREWQATPVTSPVPPQAQPFLAEPSHFGSNAWHAATASVVVSAEERAMDAVSFIRCQLLWDESTTDRRVHCLIRKLDQRCHLECFAEQGQRSVSSLPEKRSLESRMS